MTNDSLPHNVRYGFLDGGELLHLHKCTDDTYLIAKPVVGLPTLNEWTTDNVLLVVSMVTYPEDYPGVCNVTPKLLNLDATAAAVHTSYCEDGSVHKTYVPIRVPVKLPYLNLEYKCVLTLPDCCTTRYLYTTSEECRMGYMYYLPYTDVSTGKFFKCMGTVESEYLLLELTRSEVIDMLSPNGRAV